MNHESEHIHRILSNREQRRLELAASRTPAARRSPEEVFYSVDNSVKHQAKNRYGNILAYDRTAVLVDGKDYLHANVVVNQTGDQWWVAGQAPTPAAFQEFLRALNKRAASSQCSLPPTLQSKSRSTSAIIVQLTAWVDSNLRKADKYYDLPPGELAVGDEQPSNDHLALRSVERKVIAHLCSKYTELELVRSDGKPLEGIAAEGVTRIHHYRFTEWPDHGVPAGKSIEALHELVLEVDRRRKELNDCEVWVHCSAGIGRTGVFIALSDLLCSSSTEGTKEPILPSPLGPLPEELQGDRVAQTVDGIREWRGRLVQTAGQLQFIYDFMRKYSDGGKAQMPSL